MLRAEAEKLALQKQLEATRDLELIKQEKQAQIEQEYLQNQQQQIKESNRLKEEYEQKRKNGTAGGDAEEQK